MVGSSAPNSQKARNSSASSQQPGAGRWAQGRHAGFAALARVGFFARETGVSVASWGGLLVLEVLFLTAPVLRRRARFTEGYFSKVVSCVTRGQREAGRWAGLGFSTAWQP